MRPEIKKRIEQIRHGEVPKGYKKTKVGVVPAKWEEVHFREMFSRLNRRNAEGNTNVLTISAQHGLISQGEFFNKAIASEDKSNYFLLYKGEYAYNKSYSNGYPFGALKPLEMYECGIVSPLYICFAKTDRNKCPQYYTQYFEGGLMNREIKAFAQEGARNHGLLNISVNDFFNSYLLAPSFPEQNRIAAILATQDKLIDLQQKKIKELHQLKRGFLQKMFPKKGENVPEFRFPGFTNAWEQRKLGDVGETYTGLSGKTKEDFGHGDGKFVTYMNVFSNPISNLQMTEPIEIDNNQRKVQFGDVFFTTSSETPEEVGMSSVWLGNTDNTYLNSFCFGYRPSLRIDNYYLAYMLRSDEVRKNIILLAQGISRYNISKNKVMEISVPLPNIAEQQRVGSYFRELDNLITLHQRKLEEMQKYKKALMQLLLTGIVRVKA